MKRFLPALSFNALALSAFALTASVAVAQPVAPVNAPDFAVRGLDGSTATLSSYRGHPVIVSLWATWCPPCRQHMPVLEATYRRFKSAGLVILAVSDEKAETITAFGQQNNFTFPLLRPASPEINAYSSGAIPQTYLIDSAGRIIWQERGFSPSNVPVLERLIARDLGLIAAPSNRTPSRRAPITSSKRDITDEVVRQETIRRETIGAARPSAAPPRRLTKAQWKALAAAKARAQKTKTPKAKTTAPKTNRVQILSETKKGAAKNQPVGDVLLLTEDGVKVLH